MPHIDVEILAPFTAKFLEGTNLTPAERSEVLRLAQGFACKDSAAAANVSPETIRARRKRIYRKLDVPGSGELDLVSAGALASHARRRRADRAPPSGSGAAAAAGRRLPGRAGALTASAGRVSDPSASSG
ncbi:MAG: LuxR C-terminal-related transcriptional regulator [Anaeromyxobacter sp.]